MNGAGRGTPGEERICPHCRAKVLRSASVCPICQHSLRYDSHGVQRGQTTSVSALSVEGTIRHPGDAEPWEYSMVLSIRDGRGKEIARQMIGVGAFQPSESRTFTVEVSVSKPSGSGGVKRSSVETVKAR